MQNKRTILLIEDEPPLIEIIRTKLEQSGINVTVAVTVNEALEYLASSRTFDAIWLDHYLPGNGSGLDFVTKIKMTENKWNKLPIFVVSNTASSYNVKSYRQLGVSKYYVKVVHKLDEIIQEIKPLIYT